MVLSTLLQVTKNFGNSYTVNENAFKFVNQRIITFHGMSGFEYRMINNLKCILFMKKEKCTFKKLLNLLFSTLKQMLTISIKTLIKYDNFLQNC